ncbi:MAG: ABC transporter permease [Acetatifactor sp.]|nr:ABC transporter permease [Acetatifactor sp.]
MFSLMLRKLIHKKWMVFCLLIGNILLIAVATSYPLYRVSSFQRMLQDEFDRYAETENEWPTVFRVTQNTLKGGGKISFAQMEAAAEEAIDKMDVDVFEKVEVYRMSTLKTDPAVIRDGEEEKRITMAAVSNLADHIEMIDGHLPSDTVDSEGFFEVMIPDEAMMMQNILLGDEYTYQVLYYGNDLPVKVKVVGIFRPLDKTEYFWQPFKEEYATQVYTSVPLFRNTFLGSDKEKNYTMSGYWSYIWDYRKLPISQVSSLLYQMNRMEKTELLDNRVNHGAAMEILNEYSSKAKRIEATLVILQVPVLLLLCAFLYMIAGQMLQMERNEISLLRSRGASKYQVILLYFMQSSFLSVISLAMGLPLGTLFCKLLGSSTAFLEFGASRSLPVKFTGDVILYAAGAVLISVIMTTIPVISYSGLSIVNLKQSRSRQKKSLWKRLYLDVILLAISLYGYYSFRRSSDRMIVDVLSGETMDPLLYISFSLFILGAGLFCARLQPILLKIFYAVFKNRMKPSTYASILGSIRTGAKQEFIILFMILTVSIGISDTMIARTIVLNAVNNMKHIVGADLVVKERWNDNRSSTARDADVQLTYYEPDFDKYRTIEGVDELTQVLVDDRAKVGGNGGLNVRLMGIKTQGFYNVTNMEKGLLPYTYEEYLNVLSVDAQAVLVSENFMNKQGYKLGDVITYENGDKKTGIGFIYGFVNYWPGYEPVSYKINEDGTVETTDNYLIVSNLSYLQDKWGAYPYEVWMKTTDGGEGFQSWAQERPNLALTKLKNMTAEEEKIVQDTMFQGTNGILSMSFIVILLLCGVGYLIYWIMSIRSRELLFGVLRAMGMRKREINWLLIVEQICSGLFAIVTGGFIGILASRMFVPMIQQAYAASEQVLPLRLITQTGDLVQLFAVIAAVLFVCFFILARIISGMNISSALKLGED